MTTVRGFTETGPLNTAYASRLGCEAFVTRFQRLSQLGEFLTPQSLVLATVAYKRGELARRGGDADPGASGAALRVGKW